MKGFGNYLTEGTEHGDTPQPMGYIGKADRKEGLPPIRLGDTVEVTNLKLSQMTGGNQMTYADSWVKGGYTTYSDKAVDYRSETFSRQLHGKVKRKVV